MPWQCLRDGVKSLDSIGFLGWKRRIYTLFTPLEDRIGSQDMWRLKEICSENLELMNVNDSTTSRTKRDCCFLQKKS